MLDDPLSLIVQGIAVLAAGMYPLGLLFGTCSDCCCVCGRSQGSLNPDFKRWCCRGTHPEEITVRVSNGVANDTAACINDCGEGQEVVLDCTSVEGDYVLQRDGCCYSYTPEPQCDEGEEYDCEAGEFSFAGFVGAAVSVCVCDKNSLVCVAGATLEFSGACFGSGAAGVVDKVTAGEITGVKITNGGSGYATLGREQPTVTLSNTNTKAAAVSFSYTQNKDKCDRPVWAISGASVTSGGDGYTNGDPATFALAAGTKGSGATGTIYTQRAAPSLTASAPDGTGATFTVNVQTTGASPATWKVSSVTFTGTGVGYSHGSAVTFKAGTGVVTLSSATAVVNTTDTTPTVSVVDELVSGTGASLSVTLSDNGGTWSVASVSIGAAGIDYLVGDRFVLYYTDRNQYSSLFLDVSQVGGGGEIQALTIDELAPLTAYSVLDSITVTSGGEYYGGTKVLDSITITNGGEYYGENPSLAPHVSTPDVKVAHNKGTGAQVTATVEDDTADANFGKVVSLAIDDGGQDYTLTEYEDPCGPETFNVCVAVHPAADTGGSPRNLYGVSATWGGLPMIHLLRSVTYRACISGPQCDLRGVIEGNADLDCKVSGFGDITHPVQPGDQQDSCDTCNSVPLALCNDLYIRDAGTICDNGIYCTFDVEILPA